MKLFRDLALKAVYRTESDNILKDFYIPVLSASVKYDRAVGFFSASMLSYAAQGLSAFVENDGRMRLIVGGELDPEDERAIREGYEMREVLQKLGEKIIQTIEAVDDTLFQRRLEALSWLVASGRLDLKIALRKKGMYHEKIGILTDANGDRIVFQGAANETAYALLPDFNFESINVFQCWRDEFREHFMPYIVGFENLWQNNSPNTLVLDFPEAARGKLIKIAKRATRPMTTVIESNLWEKLAGKDVEPIRTDVAPSLPITINGQPFSIRPHQKKALETWKANAWRGILAHATGSGKTITAIYAAVKLYEAFDKLFVIIAVPYQNLADQWVSVLREFNILPVQCYENAATWVSKLSEQVTLYQTGALKFVCAVVVNRTLQAQNFQNILRQVSGEHLLWVGDECHHHGSARLAECLPQQTGMRLGLSATPEHYLNSAANQRLTEFYGPVVDVYGLAQAIKDEVLTPYYYHVVLINLTEEEAHDYRELSEQITRLFAMEANNSPFATDSQVLQNLLYRRARLLGSAQNKLVALGQILENKAPSPLTLFYCGDGSTEDEESGEVLRQIEAASSLLYKNGWKCAHFTSRETRAERAVLLDHFRLNMIDALVAIRCLDEGIDVPGCRTAFILASSRNPRQFIQRRGRILRRSEGKDFAEIYDFVVNIPAELASGHDCERKLMRAELERVAEFTRLALNAGDAIRALKPILDIYDLAHVMA